MYGANNIQGILRAQQNAGQQSMPDGRGGILNVGTADSEREISNQLSTADLQLANLRANLTEFIQRLEPVLRPEDVKESDAAGPVVATPIGRRIQAQCLDLLDANLLVRGAMARLEV